MTDLRRVLGTLPTNDFTARELEAASGYPGGATVRGLHNHGYIERVAPGRWRVTDAGWEFIKSYQEAANA